MKKTIIAIAASVLFALSGTASADTIFSETFDAGLGGWVAEDNNSDGYTWEHNANSGWNLTGGSGGFAMADSYSSWADDWYDTLVSPVINVDGFSSVTLSAAVSYQHDTEGGYADVSYSVDSGATWIALHDWTDTFQGEIAWGIALTPGTTELMLAFEYYQPEWSYYEFQVDDVVVSGTASAVPVPAAFWLLGTGVAALHGFRRRQRA